MRQATFNIAEGDDVPIDGWQETVRCPHCHRPAVCHRAPVKGDLPIGIMNVYTHALQVEPQAETEPHYDEKGDGIGMRRVDYCRRITNGWIAVRRPAGGIRLAA